MPRNRKLAFILTAVTAVWSVPAEAQRETFDSTGSLFDFSRQAVVFTDLSLFADLRARMAMDVKAEQEASWLPLGLIAMSDEPDGEPIFHLKYSFLLLDSLDYQGPVFGDRIATASHLVEGGYTYKTMIDIGEWYPGGMELQVGGGGEVLFTRLTSTQTPDLEQEYGFTERTKPFRYGTEWVGSVYAHIAFGPFLRWQSRLRFQRRSAVDPARVSLDGRGALRFPSRDDRTGLEFALLDEFEIAGVGFGGQVQHGETPWNFKEMLMLSLYEKIFVPDLHTTFEVGTRSFDGFAKNLFVLHGAFLELEDLGFGVNAGFRVGFDGQFYSARAGINYLYFKGEVTLQVTNRLGQPDRAFGFGVGTGGILSLMTKKGERPPADVEFGIYYNYLDHLDQLPALRDTLFITARIKTEAY